MADRPEGPLLLRACWKQPMLRVFVIKDDCCMKLCPPVVELRSKICGWLQQLPPASHHYVCLSRSLSGVGNRCLHGRRNSLLRSALLLSAGDWWRGNKCRLWQEETCRGKWQTLKGRKTEEGVRERERVGERQTGRGQHRNTERKRGRGGNDICEGET